jgi:hypothetical protein
VYSSSFLWIDYDVISADSVHTLSNPVMCNKT